MFMIISSQPRHLEVQSEMDESVSYTQSTSLRNLLNTVFGSETGLLTDFAGLGTPTVSSLSASAGDNGGEIDLTFTLDDNGGETCTFVAQYWEETTDATPSSYSETELGSSSTEGSHSYTISGLTNGQAYEVRVTAYNNWNDSGNYPAPRSTDEHWDWTNTATATPEQQQYDTPTVSTDSRVEDFNFYGYIKGFVDASSDGWDTLVVQYRFNGGTASQVDSDNTSGAWNCDAGIGTSTFEGNFTMDKSVSSSDTVEFRCKITGSDADDSNWSAWETITHGTVKTCPL